MLFWSQEQMREQWGPYVVGSSQLLLPQSMPSQPSGHEQEPSTGLHVPPFLQLQLFLHCKPYLPYGHWAWHCKNTEKNSTLVSSKIVQSGVNISTKIWNCSVTHYENQKLFRSQISGLFQFFIVAAVPYFKTQIMLTTHSLGRLFGGTRKPK